MSEPRPLPAIVDVPAPPLVPTASDSTPIPVLAEGTAPVAIPYRPAPQRIWPFFASALAIAVASAGAYAVHATREAKRELERRYPIGTTSAEKAQLDTGARRWAQGRERLLATLASFDAPSLATLKGIGACSLSVLPGHLARVESSWDDRDLDVSLHHTIRPGESLDGLAAIAHPQIDQLIDASERGRFQTTRGRDHVLRALHSAFVVVQIDELRMPELDRAHDSIAPGVIAGTAYAFDPANGSLRCAGAFHAMSSDVGPLSGFSGLDRARDVAIRDLDTRVASAIASSLRSID